MAEMTRPRIVVAISGAARALDLADVTVPALARWPMKGE
jgi:hypothetical protein